MLPLQLSGVAAVLGLVVIGGADAAPENAGSGPQPASGVESARIEIGDRLGPTGSLRDLRGNQRDLRDFRSYRAIVLVIAGTRCAVLESYVTRLSRLEERYRDQRVKFIGVYPNDGDTLDDIAAFADDRDVAYLQVKDVGHRLADELGVDRTGGVAVVDGDLTLRYRGRIDGQLSPAASESAPARKDLREAIEDIIAGRDVRVPETPFAGSPIDRGDADFGPGEVTFSRDVAPILQRRCQSCHRPGQIGPFPLMSYQDAVKRKNMIEEVVVQRRMPPWHADQRYGKFANDRRVPEDEIATVRAWVASGAPRGNPDDLPPPAEWPGGEWVAGQPDVILESPREIDVPADGVLDYIYITAPTGFDEDVWVEKAEIRPGDASVVHHVLAYILPPGTRSLYQRDGTTTALVGWVPGDNPMEAPPGTAVKIEAGSQIVWELHYTPNGTATTDLTRIGLTLAEEPPSREAKLNIFANRRIRIEPESPHHEHVATFEFQGDARLVSLMPHMHVRGKSWRYEVVYPDGRTETILSVPRWDFYWQTEYFFDELLFMPKGTVIRATARWDNSDNNILNPGPGEEVRYGLQTFEEMMNGWVRYVPEEVRQKD